MMKQNDTEQQAEHLMRFGEKAVEITSRVISKTGASGVMAAVVEQLVIEIMALHLAHTERREDLELGVEGLRAIEASYQNGK